LLATGRATMASAASGPHDQISELSLYDAGIVSLAELSDLPRMTALRSLNLHCNRIEAISNLESLGGLTYLNLSSNHIEAMTNLHGLVRLQTLDLSCNRVRIVDGLATLRSLRRLLLAYNRITSLAGLVQCHGGQLAHFEAYGNRIALIREAEYLRGLPMLAEVVLRRHGQDNPVCREPGYREKLLTLLPGLQTLDDESTTGTAPVPDRPGAAYACALEALSQPMPSASAAGVGGAGTATAHSGSQGPGSEAHDGPAAGGQRRRRVPRCSCRKCGARRQRRWCWWSSAAARGRRRCHHRSASNSVAI